LEEAHDGGGAAVTLETERLARDMVRADARAVVAMKALAWEEASVWRVLREDVRALRSALMREQLASGAWWGVAHEQSWP